MFNCVCFSVCLCVSFLFLVIASLWFVCISSQATSFDGHFYLVACLIHLFQFITTVCLLLAKEISDLIWLSDYAIKFWVKFGQNADHLAKKCRCEVVNSTDFRPKTTLKYGSRAQRCNGACVCVRVQRIGQERHARRCTPYGCHVCASYWLSRLAFNLPSWHTWDSQRYLPARCARLIPEHLTQKLN